MLNNKSYELTRKIFQRGTAKTDWCEPNYVVNDVVAEFWNTVND